MPRVKKTSRTPDSGYEFKCQACDDDVLQVPAPELVFALEAKGTGKGMRLVGSEGLQCCVECADEIKAENERLRKALGLDNAQTRAVIPAAELGLPDDILNVAKPAGSAASDEKIDKLINLVEKLIQLQVGQAISLTPGSINEVINPPVMVIVPPKHATIPKPKRSILAPPKVKANATSKAKKPATKAKAKAKPKPRPRR
jgi:hypothetical protein